MLSYILKNILAEFIRNLLYLIETGKVCKIINCTIKALTAKVTEYIFDILNILLIKDSFIVKGES